MPEYATDMPSAVLAADSMARSEAEAAQGYEQAGYYEPTYYEQPAAYDDEPYYDDEEQLDWQAEQDAAAAYAAAEADPYYGLLQPDPEFAAWEADYQARLAEAEEVDHERQIEDATALIASDFLPRDSEIDPAFVLEYSEQLYENIKANLREQGFNDEQIEQECQRQGVAEDVVRLAVDEINERRFLDRMVAQVAHVPGAR